MLHLVRHGRPLVDRSRPASTWELDPAGYDDVWALRESGRLPLGAAWFSSPEPKAIGTAELLHDGEVAVVEGLREHRREGLEWVDDLPAAVERAVAVPDAVAVPGWEPIATCRERVVATVDELLAQHPDGDLVLVGHGTAWMLLLAALGGTPPDIARWRALSMPDLIVVEDLRSGR